MSRAERDREFAIRPRRWQRAREAGWDLITTLSIVIIASAVIMGWALKIQGMP